MLWAILPVAGCNMLKRLLQLAAIAALASIPSPDVARAEGGSEPSIGAGRGPLARIARPHPPPPPRRSVPEFDPAAAGAIATVLAGGGLLIARRRRRR